MAYQLCVFIFTHLALVQNFSRCCLMSNEREQNLEMRIGSYPDNDLITLLKLNPYAIKDLHSYIGRICSGVLWHNRITVLSNL